MDDRGFGSYSGDGCTIEEYPDKKDEGYIHLYELYLDLKKEYDDTFEG